MARKAKISKQGNYGTPTPATFGLDASGEQITNQMQQLSVKPEPHDQYEIYRALARLAATQATAAEEYANRLDDPNLEDKSQSAESVRQVAQTHRAIAETYAEIAEGYKSANADHFERIESSKGHMDQWNHGYEDNS